MRPPGAARGQHIRLSPADGTSVHLDRARYELRGRDGRLICTVARERAAQGIASGALEMWAGPSGAYLQAPEACYPDVARFANVHPDSRHTLHGDKATAPANPAALYRHNQMACNEYGCGSRYACPEIEGEFSAHPEKLTPREKVRALRQP